MAAIRKPLCGASTGRNYIPGAASFFRKVVVRMATVLRLARQGRKKRPFYHLVATDSRQPRDGSFIESFGFYDPLGETSLRVDMAAADKWLATGAKPSNTVKSLIARARADAPAATAGA